MAKTQTAPLHRTSSLAAGDRVLVTGASSGIGHASVMRLALQGFRVYASVRDAAGRRHVETEARRLGVEVNVVTLDITDEAAVRETVASIAAGQGGIAGLVNNAGIALRGCFEDCDEGQLREVFETNVFGTMAVTRAVLPHMRRAGRGRIVFITSVAGLLGSLGTSAYCASKFALEGFGESLAQEMDALGIHVSLIEPGMVETPVWTTKLRYGRRALSAGSPYASWFRASEALAAKFVGESPTTPAHVADAVVTALTAARPRFRTVVGRRARMLLALRRCVPASVFDRRYLRATVGMLSREARTRTS